MKQFAIAVVLLIGLALMGCGSSSSNSNSNNVNGNWNATLVGGNKSTMFQFGTSLTADSDGVLTISNFNLTTNSQCFADGETESGSVTLSGDFNAIPSGKFGMMIQSTPPSGNSLMLSGTDKGNTISGTWTLTGISGCTGSGTFTMMKM
jgi:hypothetical protein